MIVLGIDPGLATTGFAVVEENKGQFTLLSHEAIITPPKIDTALRLEKIYTTLMQLLGMMKPDVAALETLFFGTNVTTAFSVGQARGVIYLCLAQSKIPVVEYTPVRVKMALTGYGNADKNQIQQIVKQILKLPTVLSPDDVADAAAIALTHCFSYKLVESVKRKA